MICGVRCDYKHRINTCHVSLVGHQSQAGLLQTTPIPFGLNPVDLLRYRAELTREQNMPENV